MATLSDTMLSIIHGLDYEEVRTDPKLKNLQYVTLAGSWAYGTNTEKSDVDLRGWYFSPVEDILGMENKQESEFNSLTTDSVFFSFHKLIKLLSSCNPNIVECVGTKPEHVIYCSPSARWIREDYERFLSKRAFVTFAGYATQQLRRLENALARDSYPQEEKERHILRSLEAELLASIDAFDTFNKGNSVSLYLADSEKDGYDQEVFIDLNVKGIPLRDFVSMKNQFSNQLKNYGKIRHRNHKKDQDHLCKHAMHLIRLYYMGIDILRDHRIVTYREKEHDLLMSIRHNELPMEEVFKLSERLEVELQKARDESTLPDHPNFEAINSVVIEEMNRYLKQEVDYSIDWKGVRNRMEGHE